MKRDGFCDLQSPRDLLAKAKHDLERLRANPLDTYAAFDFFVSVRHLPDWLFPSDPDRQTAIFKGHVEMRVARHIADRGKHFTVSNSRHKQVVGSSVHPGSFSSDSFDPEAFAVHAFDMPSLIVELDQADPDTASIGRRVNALELAEKVFAVATTIVA